MDKSKIISVRLSNPESESVENFMKEIGMKSTNDFFRYSAAFCISMTKTITHVVNSPELNSMLENANKAVLEELQKVPETQAKLQGKYEFIENTIMPKIEQEIDKGKEFVKPFAQERSAGRPPNTKAKPGRPKEQGY